MAETYATTVVGFPSPIEVWYKIDRSDCVTRVSVDRIGIEDPRRLIGSIWHSRP